MNKNRNNYLTVVVSSKCVLTSFRPYEAVTTIGLTIYMLNVNLLMCEKIRLLKVSANVPALSRKSNSLIMETSLRYFIAYHHNPNDTS